MWDTTAVQNNMFYRGAYSNQPLEAWDDRSMFKYQIVINQPPEAWITSTFRDTRKMAKNSN